MSTYGFARGFDEYGMNQADLFDTGLAEKAGREAVAWIEEIGDRPFFLFLHTYQVHCPYKSPESIQNLFLGAEPPLAELRRRPDLGGRARHLHARCPTRDRDNVIGLYDAGIRTTDEGHDQAASGRPPPQGIYDRTMIVLTSDHGDELYEHGGVGSHARPLRRADPGAADHQDARREPRPAAAWNRSSA